MSPICRIIRASLDDYLGDALPAPQRRMLRDHLAACRECAEIAAAQDPTLRFARLAPEEVTATEAAQILSAVRTGVSLMETERRIGHKSRRRVAGFAAAAAAAALVAVLGGNPVRRAPAAEARVTPAPPVSDGPGEIAAAALPADPAPSPDATVYDWNPGAAREEPRVVWIVDRGLDI